MDKSVGNPLSDEIRKIFATLEPNRICVIRAQLFVGTSLWEKTTGDALIF